MTTPLPRPGFADVEAAAARLAGKAHRTAVLTSRTADATAGGELFFKPENFQRVGAFKFRGAYNAIAALPDEARAAGIVTFSSGNHAQAIACAAAMLGTKATIVMPHDAPAMKRAATAGYGGEIISYHRYTEDRTEIGRRLASERGLTLIPPFDHPDVIAGQGTVALELLTDVPDLDTLVVPLGGGGLLAGCAIAARHLNPGISIIGVEPEAGDDGRQSLQQGSIVTIPVPHSIADGALTPALGAINFPIIADLVDQIVTVPDAALIDAMRFFAERMKLFVEPTGALAAAAAFTGVVPTAGRRTGIVISGGNVDTARFASLLAD
ncbi:threo-3-hydroxy-L-aspartate ammonia-lyase [Devosia sp.]|uniref:threo-3-hydroxy-L-aspartate ammonia-lyase n=1 Tax=Devosia sp. TaxID=1871048 RepID=UPI003A953399